MYVHRLTWRSQASPVLTVHSIHNNGAEDQWKNGGLGAFIMWVDARWTWGGGADIQICTHWNLKASFLPVKTSSFVHANVWSSNCGRAFEWIIQCIVLVVGPLPPMSTSPPPLVHLLSTWHHSHDEYSQAFPIFHRFSSPTYYCEDKWR